MAAHWSNEMITLFPAVLYHRNKQGCLQHASYAVVSNEKTHDKGCVLAVNTANLEDVKLITDAKKVHNWSDGPSSQVRN